MARALRQGGKGKNNRKFGRNKDACQRYKLANTREKNKIKKVKKHLKKYPKDGNAIGALARLEREIKS